MIDDIFSDIGLSKNGTKIYLALLELGPSGMGALCKKTKIHRRNVYDSIEMLKGKGFVSAAVINNRHVFEAVDPHRILDILDERRANVESVLPTLIASRRPNQPGVRVYTGLSGRKVIFEDKLNYREEQYVLGAHLPSGKISMYLENYHRRRVSRRIPLKMLFVHQDCSTAKTFSKYRYLTARLLPDRFASPIAINIYGDKTAILLGSGNLDPISILITDSGLADDFKTYFSLLWKMSHKL